MEHPGLELVLLDRHRAKLRAVVPTPVRCLCVSSVRLLPALGSSVGKRSSERAADGWTDCMWLGLFSAAWPGLWPSCWAARQGL